MKDKYELGQVKNVLTTQIKKLKSMEITKSDIQQIENVKESRKFLWFSGATKATGADLNKVIANINSSTSVLSDRVNGIIEQLGAISYIISFLNKEYLERITNAQIEALEASNKALQNESDISKNLECLSKTIDSFIEFKKDVEIQLRMLDTIDGKKTNDLIKNIKDIIAEYESYKNAYDEKSSKLLILEKEIEATLLELKNKNVLFDKIMSDISRIDSQLKNSNCILEDLSSRLSDFKKSTNSSFINHYERINEANIDILKNKSNIDKIFELITINFKNIEQLKNNLNDEVLKLIKLIEVNEKKIDELRNYCDKRFDVIISKINDNDEKYKIKFTILFRLFMLTGGIILILIIFIILLCTNVL